MQQRPRSLRPYLTVALVLLPVAVLLGLYAWRVDGAAWEVRLTLWLQDAPIPLLRRVSVGLAYAGHGAWWVGLVGALGFALWALAGLRLVLLLGVTAALQDLGSLVKLVVERARPDAATVEVWREIGSSSFPSGHTLGATLVFGFLFFALEHCALSGRQRLLLRVVCIAWIALMGLGRVRLGAHWPTDVLGAYCLGALLLLPMVYTMRRHLYPRALESAA